MIKKHWIFSDFSNVWASGTLCNDWNTSNIHRFFKFSSLGNPFKMIDKYWIFIDFWKFGNPSKLLKHIDVLKIFQICKLRKPLHMIRNYRFFIDFSNFRASGIINPSKWITSCQISTIFQIFELREPLKIIIKHVEIFMVFKFVEPREPI